MKGDFTRFGFDPGNAFTRVLMQQGRVQLDSDWNEWQEMRLHADRIALRDAIAAAAVPAENAGFAVGLSAAANDITLSPGRLYVAGIACENPYLGVSLSLQPWLSLAAPGVAGFAWPATSGRYLAYLDVWERGISALEQPSIRETALGGPDTTSRTRLIWQLRLEPVATNASTEDFAPGWTPAAFAFQAGAMGAATAAPPAAGPCTLPLGASYTSLTNQLYRVDIHGTGLLNADGTGAPMPNFKWSRDNGSVATTVLSAAGQTLGLADLGADDALNFAQGQVVEITDEHMALSGQAGSLLLIAGVDPIGLTVTIDPGTPVPAVDFTGPVILRRWDQAGSATLPAIAVGAGPLPLEAGLQVSFQPGFYRAGDYWTIPARTAIDLETGDIIWPAGTSLPAQGIAHNYVPLALVDYVAPATAASPPAGKFALVEDCRAIFAPAAGRFAPVQARYADGSRQRPLLPGQSVRLDSLAQGLMIATATPLDAGSVSAGSIQLLAELPVTMSQVLPQNTDQRVVGSQLVVLRSSASLATPNRIVVTLGQPAQDLLTAALARKLNFGTQTDFAQLFATVDFVTDPTKFANWQVAADGTLVQANPTVAYTAGAAFPPSMALSVSAPSLPLGHAGASVGLSTQGGAVDLGMVFNWTSNADFWVFYVSIYGQAVGFSGGFEAYGVFVVHYVNGTAAYTAVSGQNGLSAPSNNAGVLPWTADLDITTSSGGLIFAAAIHWSNGTTTNTSINPSPPPPAAAPAAASAAVVARLDALLPVRAPIAAPIGKAIALPKFPIAGGAFSASPTLTVPIDKIPPIALLPVSGTVANTGTHPGISTAAPVVAPVSPYPSALLAGARLGVMARGNGHMIYTRLQWTDVSNASVNALPIGGTAPVLLRLIAKRALLRSYADGQSGPAVSFSPPAEADFETCFFVTPAAGGPYSAIGQAGIGADKL